ncbi:MAG: MmgE/PrpD family protein [Rhodospirillaceae bacterium]|jgi:aconitate decarboxylase|nr:MmgE/PrpD family protein [Rhodospirillaceae bacterium]MBT5194183.1 MmgE/PrpD family protein [Rhodospirillaceae bacterium]MBT5898324.1 MmgE/PrpD family protein [Rhodospirillaceae bacterium]MBT6428062.1 MmgE/PrpD family protein [Rhodospirillaceae bacterium]MBT7757986.1 MmgE/PrpD family protein [Rhodospirillaceae bacterium]
MDAIEDFVEHVRNTAFPDVPEGAIRAAKTFILDSFGVGLSGGGGPWVDEMIQLTSQWGKGDDARVWGHGQPLPAPAAALCNAYQIHNAEFDCVHEGAVVHSMTVLLGGAMAVAERDGGVTGKDLMLAAILGVDVACHIAVAVTTGLKFFRPGTAGALAAVTAIGKLKGFDSETLRHAYSIAYGQMCGTMQAHTEGSALLGMQVGFNARNAVVACDMAAAGLQGPRNILEGPFGFFRLFEDDYDRDVLLRDLGRTWRITELSHKPYPSGRATHGIVDGCLRLQRQEGFTAAEIERIEAAVPPLIHHLVGRPVEDTMTTNYARLCAQYVTSHALHRNGIGVDAYDPSALTDPETMDLARRIRIEIDDNPDPNALVPVAITVILKSGAHHAIAIQDVYGSPANPMTHAAHLDKFRGNCAAAPRPMDAASVEALIETVEELETLDDVSRLVDLMIPAQG